jgi:hypothetical protein
LRAAGTKLGQRIGTKLLRFILLCAATVFACTAVQAGTLKFCDQPVELSAAQQDKLFRLASIIRKELEATDTAVALIARSGLNLRKMGVRYSHAGLSLRANKVAPWSVRQLYYACDEQRPRIFDQGLSAFVLGFDDVSIGYVSVIVLPPTEAAELEVAALDNQRALQYLNPIYSANAYAFSDRYQNCNQWVAEMLAAAWGKLSAADNARSQAQRWLADHGYMPSVFAFALRPLIWLSRLIPFVHLDDHPSQDLDQKLMRVSMPEAIEQFVHRQIPNAQRLEFCHTDRQVVVRRGWTAIAEGCHPGDGDTVISLE